TYSLKKIKLLRLVIVLSLIYSILLALLDFFKITEHIDYRLELMSIYAICNIVLLYFSMKSTQYSKNDVVMTNIVLILALIVFTITMIIYPLSEIRIMWYFFTIMIAYYVGGRTTGHVVALASIIIIFGINSIFNLQLDATTQASVVIGILFISQMSNYFVNILNKNEEELYNYQNNLEDMIEAGLKEIADLNEEIIDTQKEVVFTMGSIGESRSKETGNHVKRVAEYSKILALAYGKTEDEAELLRTASPMHDIGKVAIPDAILKKPGKLTKDEFEIMKTHASLGHDMLKMSTRPILNTAAIVSYQHHERWDGKGYPNGLKGEETHLYGRITAIADVFDALGSQRVYKPAWDDEKIFKLFKEESGHQFDPKLIDLFFENKDAILDVRDKFSDT
ncbi:MAG: HD domain-containing protein, partial [Campylobacterota bacterium]|nr:HD domain-containing protein [Campylobacterota bacterium]